MGDPALNNYDDENESEGHYLSARERASLRWGSDDSGETNSAESNSSESSERTKLKSIQGGGETTPRGNFAPKLVGRDSDSDEPADGAGGKILKKGISAGAGGGAGLILKGVDRIRKNKKKGFGGLLIGVLMTGAGILGVMYVSGPLELIHMSKLLTGFHMSAHEDQSDVRVSRIARYIREPDKPQNTRLGILGNSFADRFETKINASGIESKYKTKFGYGDGYAVNRDNDTFKNLSDDAVKAKLISDFGVPENAIKIDGKQISFDVGSGYVKNARLSKSLLKSVNYSKISAWQGSRLLGTRAGVTWHPIKKADQKVLTTVAERLKAWQDARKAQITAGGEVALLPTEDPPEKEGKPTNTSASDEAKSSNAEVADKAAAAANSDDPKVMSDYKSSLKLKIASGAAGAVGIACMAKALNETVTTQKQDKIIKPLMRVGVSAVSTGGQTQAGIDEDLEQNKAVSGLMHGKDSRGKVSSWNDAVSIRTNLGLTGGVKPDDTLKSLDKGGPFDNFFNFGGVGPAMGAACSTAGTIILTGFSFAMAPISTIVTGVAGYFYLDDALNFIARWFTGSGIDPLAVGADYGLNADYGFLLASNEVNLTNGGTALSPKDLATIQSTSDQLNNEEFSSGSFAARTFAADDPRSAVGRLIDTHSGEASQTTSNIASSLLQMPANIGSMFGNLFSMNKAQAATGRYDYKIPIYGFSQQDMEDDSVQNPFANAKRAAALFDSGRYIDDAKSCFNVDIVNTGGVWDVNALNEDGVDAYSGSYDNDKCSKTGDKDWLSVRFFIFDTLRIKTLACNEGDAQSCEDIGVTVSDDVCTGTATPGTVPTVDGGTVPSWVELPSVNAPIGGPVTGIVSAAAANIRSEDTFVKNLGTIRDNNPDFVALNEVSDQSLQRMEQIAKGYGAYRDNTIDPTSGSRNDLANAILWRADTWNKLDSGRVKITNHDYAVFGGTNVDWNRYAVWGVFQRKSDGAVVSFVASHMMVNPSKYPRQWKATDPPMTRIEQYADSMNNMKALIGVLAEHGPVLMGGDMNSHPGEGDWTAVSQMGEAGYGYNNDEEVIYMFNPQGTKVVDNKVVMLDLHGDHDNKSLQTKIDMNGAGPSASSSTPSSTAADCTPTGGGGSYKIGEFNVKGENHFPGGGSVAHAKKRMIDAANVISSSSYDIVGLQEMQETHKQRAEFIKALGESYGIYPAKNAPNDGHSTENSIIWNSTKFKMIESGTTNGKYFNGSLLKMPYVKLQDLQSGQSFYVSNTHDPADTQGQAAQHREFNVGVHLENAKRWTASGVPVIMTGDYNWGYNIREGGPTSDFYHTGSDAMKSPYCLITKDNILLDAQDVFKGKTGACPSNTNQINGPGARTVDHILVSSGLTVPTFEIVTSPTINSITDHPGIFTAVVTLPGQGASSSSTGTFSGTVAWPVDKKWWDADRTDFLGGHPTYSGTFTSPYTKGVAADIGNPKDGSPIYSMLDGVVEKTNLCGKGEGMIIKSKVPGGTLHIAYGHGTNPRFAVNQTVKAGQQILNLGAVGCQVSGGHLHIDMSLGAENMSQSDKHVCPQDVFLAMGLGQTPDFQALVSRARSNCSR